jgi:hypothetical protein
MQDLYGALDSKKVGQKIKVCDPALTDHALDCFGVSRPVPPQCHVMTRSPASLSIVTSSS